jgi:hypothetical protein
MRYSRLRLRQIVPVARHGADDLSGDKTTYRYLTQSRGGDPAAAGEERVDPDFQLRRGARRAEHDLAGIKGEQAQQFERCAVVNRHGAVVVGEGVHLEHTRSDGERRGIDRVKLGHLVVDGAADRISADGVDDGDIRRARNARRDPGARGVETAVRRIFPMKRAHDRSSYLWPLGCLPIMLAPAS